MSSLDPILKPRSVAVVGASRAEHTIGHQVVSNLILRGYTGAVYPVNPKASAVHSIPAYARVADIPTPPDLAVVVVPKEYVADVAEECGAAGVRGLVVISAGFREIGGTGVEREQRLVDVVRGHGMRMVGPNCLGVLNTHPDVRMNATFAPVMPPHGRAGIVSQSGAIGLSVLDYAAEYGIGVSQFVSIGNKPDVSGNDVLLQWEDDDTVEVILLYVESFGNPAKFREIASRIARRKPIIALKGGRSQSGGAAASSHTGALAANDVAVDALLAQSGVLRAGSIEELFDMAMGFSGQALPRSRRTVVVTNAGGPGILVADALEMHGLEVPPLADETVERMRPLFPEEASLRNPLDMIASARPASYRTALGHALADPGVDAAVAIFVPPLGVKQEAVAEAIAASAQEHAQKPVFAVLMGREGLNQGRAELNEARIPAYIFPESAARALAAMNRYREWVERPASRIREFDIDVARAQALIDRTRAEGRTRLREPEALELLEIYGIPVAGARLATSPAEAERAARDLGGRVVLKVVSPDIVHKSDIGGVRVGVAPEQVAGEYGAILERVRRAQPDAHVEGVLVQRMGGSGHETIAGISRDRLFGPLVMFGLGGIFVEAIGDVVFRVAPIDEAEAHDMINSIRGSKILGGVRGQAPADVDAIADVLMRLARLAVDLPGVRGLDVNPLLAGEAGVTALDARVILEEGGAP
ncbi:MAG TPA: acetate--CoA ligase family protein [Longimicrobiales bacterium]